MDDGMPELEDYDDDGMPELTCIFYGIALHSADSCREDGRVIKHLPLPETR